ncbi:hypothetical protein [Sulfitobacter guttiformis]|nr:hypothetical protein [Sulfitobacter guttiformis]KIN72750.1 hypothetical protein Z949_1929 [Sulfitobacter guttiformis KCTC 32187]
MYIGPEGMPDDTVELAKEMSLNEVLARTSHEIGAIRDAVGQLEDWLITSPTVMRDTGGRKLLQSIDPIQQSLEALSRFVGSVACQPCLGKTSIQTALTVVHLADLRNRLGNQI